MISTQLPMDIKKTRNSALRHDKLAKRKPNDFNFHYRVLHLCLHLCGRRKLLGYQAGTMTQPPMGLSGAIFMGLSTGLCGKKEYVWHCGILQTLFYITLFLSCAEWYCLSDVSTAALEENFGLCSFPQCLASAQNACTRCFLKRTGAED